MGCVAATNITEELDDVQTDVDVASFVGFPTTVPFTVRIEGEWMRVTAGAETLAWTVTRGYNGTTAAEHDDDTAIYLVPDTYPDLARIKRRLRGAVDTETDDDDDVLSDFICDAHSYLVGRIGLFLGPSATASIDVDGCEAVERGTKLYVPFGIQELTTVEVYDGASWVEVTDDLLASPREWEPRLDPNQPTTVLRFKSTVAGSYTSFPDGNGDVRITGTLGWPAPPQKVGEIGDTLVIRMFQARMTGQRDFIGTDEEGNPVVSRFLSAADHRVLDSFRFAVYGFRG